MDVSDLLSSTLLAAAGVAATAGYAVVALSPAEFRHSRIAFCVAGAFAGLAIFVWGTTTDVALIPRLMVTTLFGGVILASTTEATRWIARRELQPHLTADHAQELKTKAPLNMWQVFDTDFQEVGRTSVHQLLVLENPKGVTQDVQFALYWDIPTNSYFIGIYFYNQQYTKQILVNSENMVDLAITTLSQIRLEISSPGDSREIVLQGMKFSSQVYLYLDANLTSQEIVQTEAAYKARGYDAIVRTSTYLFLHRNEASRSATTLAPPEQLGAVTVRLPGNPPDGMDIRVKYVPAQAEKRPPTDPQETIHPFPAPR